MTDIQPTSGDRVRLEALVKCLVDGGTHLAILSDYDEVLDHFARQIQQRLREAIRCEIEFCTSTNSAQLVDKFNQLLGQLTIDEALDKEAQHAPRRYLIFRDSILVQEFEMQLLARLVKAFPAGNISVILLINSANNHRGKLEAFGKNLLQWRTETQAGARTEPLRDITQDDPVDPPVLRDVVAEGHSPSITLSTPAGTPDERAEPVLAAAADGSMAAGPTASAADAGLTSPARPFPWGLLLGVVLVSFIAVGILYRDRVVAEYDALKRYVSRTAPEPAATPVRVEPAPPEAARAESAVQQAEDDKEEVILSASRAADAPAPVAAPTPDHTADKAADKAADKTPPPAVADQPSPAAASPPPAKPDVKSVPANAGNAWADRLQPGTYVVQLAAFDTQDETLVFQRGHAVYANAQVLKVRSKSSSKTYFVLVAGPMPSKAEAEAFMRSHPLLAKGWLRSSKSLKAQL